MKKLIMIGVYGALIFGAAAGGTWFLRQKDVAKQMADDEAAEKAKTNSRDLETAVDITQPLSTPPPEAQSEELPVAIRPEEITVEEIVQYGLGLKERETAIRAREESLKRTEAKYRLVLADIEGEKQEIDGMVAQARDQRIASEQILKQVQQERMASEKLLHQTKQQQKEMEGQKREMMEKQRVMDMERKKDAVDRAVSAGGQASEVNHEANVKELVSVMAGMNPEGAAKVLREFANDGRIETAVEILSKLEERKAASILDAMDDPKLVTDLAAKFLDIKRPLKL